MLLEVCWVPDIVGSNKDNIDVRRNTVRSEGVSGREEKGGGNADKGAVKYRTISIIPTSPISNWQLSFSCGVGDALIACSGLRLLKFSWPGACVWKYNLSSMVSTIRRERKCADSTMQL